MTPTRIFKAVFAVIVGFVVATAALDGCSSYYAWKHGGYYKLQNFAPYIHNDAVVVLASGVYKASGKLYFIEKQGDNFALTQKLDLAPYLKGRTPRKLAFNERYLVATAFKGALAFDEFYGEGEKSRASLLVFKKNDDGRWEFLCDFKPSDVNLNSARLVLTERDQIIANDPHYLENGFHGVLLVYEIDAENRSLTLAQEITSDEPRDPGYAALKGRRFFDGFGDSFFYAADLLVVRQRRSPLLTDISAKSTDWSVYRWNGSRWAYETSLLKLLPQSVSTRRVRTPKKSASLSIFCPAPRRSTRFDVERRDGGAGVGVKRDVERLSGEITKTTAARPRRRAFEGAANVSATAFFERRGR